jgi:predicted transcriptional regulator
VKTTIEIPDDLADRARRCAAESQTTLRSLMEEALRRGLDRRQTPAIWTADPSLTFGAAGLTQQSAAMSWAELRDLAMQR